MRLGPRRGLLVGAALEVLHALGHLGQDVEAEGEVGPQVLQIRWDGPHGKGVEWVDG